MSQPITLDVPNTVGKAEAKRRMEARFHKLGSFIPGAAVTDHRWEGDALLFTVEGMGQRVASKLTVFDDRVHVEVDLPPFLALFADKIRGTLAKEAPKLLE